jgi:hypothetical protein
MPNARNMFARPWMSLLHSGIILCNGWRNTIPIRFFCLRSANTGSGPHRPRPPSEAEGRLRAHDPVTERSRGLFICTQ